VLNKKTNGSFYANTSHCIRRVVTTCAWRLADELHLRIIKSLCQISSACVQRKWQFTGGWYAGHVSSRRWCLLPVWGRHVDTTGRL